MAKIIVRVKDDGSIEVAVEGVAGPSCSDLTRAVEKALGKTTSDKRTAEFLRAPNPSQVNLKRGS